MDAMQFSLFFVALLVGYVLVHLRLLRFEEHLQKLAGIRGLDDRLRALDDRLRVLIEAFDRLRLERTSSQLDRLHDDLEDLRESVVGVRQAVVEIPAPLSMAVPVAAEAPAMQIVETSTARLLAAVETRLLQLGYRNVEILTELGSLRIDSDVELQVECERGNMPVKGRVVVRNGSVREVALQSVAPMFP